MSFVRDLNDGQSYAVVGLAIGADQEVSVSPVRNGLYRDAVSGREVRVGDGRLAFPVRANSAGVYVLNGPGRIGEDERYLR
jgi:hypothetical protein